MLASTYSPLPLRDSHLTLPGSTADSPETALAALLQLHASWIQAAGGTVSVPGVGSRSVPGVCNGTQEALVTSAKGDASLTDALEILNVGETGCVGVGVEISPLVSYAGEGLETSVSGRIFASCWDDALQR